jgi:hypothetical protein
MKSLNLKQSILATGATLILAGATAAQTLQPQNVTDGPANKCTITTVQTKTNATPSPQLTAYLSTLHPAGYNVTQPNHNFGDSFHVCVCEVCSAKLEIRVAQTTPRDLPGNDGYTVGIAPFATPADRIASGTIWPSNSAAPAKTITINLNPQQLTRLLCGNKGWLDLYVEDDTTVLWTRLTTTHP